MGWNRLTARRRHALLEGIEDGSHVYFVHSYYCEAADEVTIASTDYGRDLPAIVGRSEVLGVQFHPEKSQSVGLRMLENWVRTVGPSRGLEGTVEERGAGPLREAARGGR
jgi:glutamine amidotransferase